MVGQRRILGRIFLRDEFITGKSISKKGMLDFPALFKKRKICYFLSNQKIGGKLCHLPTPF